jgi:hypothetical protein
VDVACTTPVRLPHATVAEAARAVDEDEDDEQLLADPVAAVSGASGS